MTFSGENTGRGVTEQEVTSRLHPLGPPCLGHITHFSELRGLTLNIFQNLLLSLLHCRVGKRPWKTFEKAGLEIQGPALHKTQLFSRKGPDPKM